MSADSTLYCRRLYLNKQSCLGSNNTDNLSTLAMVLILIGVVKGVFVCFAVVAVCYRYRQNEDYYVLIYYPRLIKESERNENNKQPPCLCATVCIGCLGSCATALYISFYVLLMSLLSCKMYIT